MEISQSCRLVSEGDKSQAICSHCQAIVTTTFQYRNVQLNGCKDTIKNILTGVCDQCGIVASIPAQSTPAIQSVLNSYS